MGMINEAVRLVEEGVADAATVDRICRECFGYKMGPLETADLIGLDTIEQTLAVLAEAISAERYAASPALRARVAQGKLGRKSGAGFYPHAG
jgi:3-hydroxybutyryl-CoA dehydrogenase